MWIAVKGGNVKLIEMILSHDGVDVNATNATGVTPLRLAAFFGRVEALKLLLSAGADQQLANRKGQTAFHISVERGHDACVTALEEAQAAQEAQGKPEAPKYDWKGVKNRLRTMKQSIKNGEVAAPPPPPLSEVKEMTDVFVSHTRDGDIPDAMLEELNSALYAKDLNCMASQGNESDATALSACRLALVIGTTRYGVPSDVAAAEEGEEDEESGTAAEIRTIIDQGIPFLLAVAVDEFDENSILSEFEPPSRIEWKPGDDINLLVSRIVAKMAATNAAA